MTITQTETIEGVGLDPIKILCDYYDVLNAQKKLIPEEYTDERIDYVLLLNRDGQLVDIMDHHYEEIRISGKKEKAVTLGTLERLPKRVQKKDSAYALDHRGKYVLGLTVDNDQFVCSNTEQKAFDTFVAENSQLIENLHTPLIDAYRQFMATWKPSENLQHPKLLPLLKKFDQQKFIFALEEEPTKFLHNEPTWVEHWLNVYHAKDIPSAHVIQDSTTGEKNQLNTRIHEKIKRMPKGLGQGNSLVSFKYDGYMSYNHENQKSQSTDYNANISYQQMVKYTTALNYILENRQFIQMNNLVLIPIVLNKEKDTTDDLLAWLNNDLSNQDHAQQLQQYLQTRLSQSKAGLINQTQLVALDDYDTDVYLLGLEANSARIMVKLFERQSYGRLIQNIADFQTDIQMTPEAKPVSMYILSKQTIPSFKDKPDDRIANQLLSAVIRNNTIPRSVYRQILKRLNVEPDSFNGIKAGMLKKYLNDNRKEITMTLNTNATEPAYIYGQIFALIEQIQYKALGKVNRNIKKQYFATALTKPSKTFPRLITMVQKYLDKFKNDGQRIYYDKILSELIVRLEDTLPKKFNEKEKGLFALGYYQQRETFYAPKKEVTDEENNETTEDTEQ